MKNNISINNNNKYLVDEWLGLIYNILFFTLLAKVNPFYSLNYFLLFTNKFQQLK